MNTRTIKAWEVTSDALPPLIIMAWNKEYARFVWHSELSYCRSVLSRGQNIPVTFSPEDIPPVKVGHRHSYSAFCNAMNEWNVRARPAKAWSKGNQFWLSADPPNPQAVECDPWYAILATQDLFQLSRWVCQISAYDRSPGSDNTLHNLLKDTQSEYGKAKRFGATRKRILMVLQILLVRLSMELPAVSSQAVYKPRKGYVDPAHQASSSMTEKEFIAFHQDNIGVSNGAKIMEMVGRETNFNALNRSNERHRNAIAILVSGYGLDIRGLDAREVKALWEGGTSELTLEGHCIELGIKDIW